MTDEVNGPVYNFFKEGRWVKNMGMTVNRHGDKCYCLSSALWEFYAKGNELDTIEVKEKKMDVIRDRVLDVIKRLYPTRFSPFATKLSQSTEPMAGEQFTIVGFNDHPSTNLQDILAVCKEAKI